MKKSLVKDWMTRELVTISPNTELQDIQQLMIQMNIRRLPVVENNRLVGIVTQGDVRSAISLNISDRDGLSINLSAEEIMTPNPLTIFPDTTIGEAAWLMRNNKIGGLLVVDDDEQIVGIITESDIFDMIVEEWNQS